MRTEEGNELDLEQASASAYGDRYGTTVITYYHAEVGVYTPAPGGGSYCYTARCTHNHTGADVTEQLDLCRSKLARIIDREHRVPKWATLHG